MLVDSRDVSLEIDHSLDIWCETDPMFAAPRIPNRNAPSFFVAFGRFASHSTHSPMPLIQSIADFVIFYVPEESLLFRCVPYWSFYVDGRGVTWKVTNDMGASALSVSPRFQGFVTRQQSWQGRLAHADYHACQCESKSTNVFDVSSRQSFRTIVCTYSI